MDQEELLNQMHAAALAGEPAVVLELTSGAREGDQAGDDCPGRSSPPSRRRRALFEPVIPMCPRCLTRAGRWPARSKC